jgi:hypothetical protein
MAKKKNLSPKYQVWIDARKRFHLSHDHIRMARELGLNPKKFGKLANHKQEPWKLPLPEYIEYLYFKHFKKEPLKNSLSIEQQVKLKKQKNAERKERKRQEKAKETIEHVPATKSGTLFSNSVDRVIELD